MPGESTPGIVTGALYPNNFSGYTIPGRPNPECSESHRAPRRVNPNNLGTQTPKTRNPYQTAPKTALRVGGSPSSKSSRYSAASPLQSVIEIGLDSVGFSVGVTSIMRFLARSINSCSCSTICSLLRLSTCSCVTWLRATMRPVTFSLSSSALIAAEKLPCSQASSRNRCISLTDLVIVTPYLLSSSWRISSMRSLRVDD